MQNGGKEKNAGIQYRCNEKTEEWKITEKYR
jgi:hypothetical protein